MISVLFVCLGNICRSPTAEAVFRSTVEREGLLEAIRIDSAGTSGWHIGSPPDKRAIAAGKQRGYDLGGLRGREVTREDFSKFHYILAMDEQNLSDLRKICPPNFSGKLSLFLDYAHNFSESEVPDPYYGGAKGFEHVLDLVEDACKGLIHEIQREHSL